MKYDHELHLHLIPYSEATEDQKEDYTFLRRIFNICSELDWNMNLDNNISTHSTEIFLDHAILNYTLNNGTGKVFGIIPIIQNNSNKIFTNLDDNDYRICGADIDGNSVDEDYGYFWAAFLTPTSRRNGSNKADKIVRQGNRKEHLIWQSRH